ncbi:isopentenyl transferase family protein [Actinacidiphila glaucinigra]|uniref:isopentenyl transferase family protein n=1 Tax=Actinacidiphila glaucinigra TaxID=235986 RepID=UPI00339F05AE
MISLQLILGPTGVGKTSRSVALAHRDESPVLVLDRVQCHPQLAIGSGRPTQVELQDTVRYYLTERPLHHGVITAADAVDRLVHHRKMIHDSGVDRLILEGGSISILTELLTRTDWFEDATVAVECWLEASASAYEARVTERVEQMLGYSDHSHRTMLDELAELWLHPEARPRLHSIAGYREVIDLCAAEGLDPMYLRGLAARMRRTQCATAITSAHLDYARRQRLALATAVPELVQRGFEVTLCEI